MGAVHGWSPPSCQGTLQCQCRSPWGLNLNSPVTPLLNRPPSLSNTEKRTDSLPVFSRDVTALFRCSRAGSCDEIDSQHCRECGHVSGTTLSPAAGPPLFGGHTWQLANHPPTCPERIRKNTHWNIQCIYNHQHVCGRHAIM